MNSCSAQLYGETSIFEKEIKLKIIKRMSNWMQPISSTRGIPIANWEKITDQKQDICFNVLNLCHYDL
jgi:hypothetical protein